MIEKILHAVSLLLVGIWIAFPTILVMDTMGLYGYLVLIVAILDAGLILWGVYQGK